MSANLDLDDVVADHPVATQELTDLRARLAKAEKDAEELTDLAYRLATGLIRARQNLFPNIDQAEVIHRDFPRIAAIAKERK